MAARSSQYDALRAEIAVLRTEIAALRAPQQRTQYQRNAAVVWVDQGEGKRPFYTAFTKGEAYRLMEAAKSAGHRASYHAYARA